MNIEQVEKLIADRETLGLTPGAMATAMGVTYDTYKDWQSGRRNMRPTARRCIELLLALKGTRKGKKFGV